MGGLNFIFLFVKLGMPFELWDSFVFDMIWLAGSLFSFFLFSGFNVCACVSLCLFSYISFFSFPLQHTFYFHISYFISNSPVFAFSICSVFVFVMCARANRKSKDW